MRQSSQRKVIEVFSDEVMEKILSNSAISPIPINYRSTMIHIIFEALDDLDLLKEGAKD